MNCTVYSQHNNNNNDINNNSSSSSKLAATKKSSKVSKNGIPFQDVTNHNLSSSQQPQQKKNNKKIYHSKEQHHHHQASSSSLLPSSSATTIPNNVYNNNTGLLNPVGAIIPSSSVRQQQKRKQHQQQQAVLGVRTTTMKNSFEEEAEFPVVVDVDIDKKDRQTSNLLSVPEYVDSIYQYLREKERKFGPLPNAIHLGYEHDDDENLIINTNFLSIVIDWLMAVNDKFQCSSEVIHLTVSIVYRYLAANASVSRDDLQLVGITAFFLAAKYEEIWVPTLDELCYICADAYHQEDIIEMEIDILQTIRYDVSCRPSSYKFLQRFCKAAAATATATANTATNKTKTTTTTRRIANYLLDGTLLDHHLQTTYLPSELAAASLLIALKASTSTTTNNNNPDHELQQQQEQEQEQKNSITCWNYVLEHHTQYSELRLINVAKDILLKKKSIPGHLQQVDKNHSRIATTTTTAISLDAVLSCLMMRQQSMSYC